MKLQIRLPEEYKQHIHTKRVKSSVEAILSESGNVHTVCKEAKCPNIGECFKKGTATFLIMGGVCTRNCAFCAIESGTPDKINIREADEVVDAIGRMGLKYAVLTSVTRDDLQDGGASYFSDIVKKIKAKYPEIKIEILVPDFNKNINNLKYLSSTPVDVFNHNLETVKRLYSDVRKNADYDISLKILIEAKNMGFTTKTGIMVGIGETIDELKEVFCDIKKSGVDILTIGQYFMPTQMHYKVRKYYLQEEFEQLEIAARTAGINQVVSGVFVRSSYHAFETYKGAI